MLLKSTPHQPTFLALRISAENGCQLCRFLCMSLEQGFQGQKYLDLSLLSAEYPGCQLWLRARDVSLDRIILSFNESGGPTDSDGPPISSYGLPPGCYQKLENPLGYLDLFADSSEAEQPPAICGRPLPTSAGNSAEDFEVVRGWLVDCVNTHPLCASPRPDAPLPKRVIDVGPTDGSQEPRLVLTSGQKLHDQRYATLSHCWGGALPLSTTSGTLDERIAGIPIASLPKTFRDAVVIVRELGLRLLWIDSLCIVQDSREDWEVQSAVMGDIYRGGYINIAARAAANGSVGCFVPRVPEPQPCRIPRWSRDGTIAGFMYFRSPAFRIEDVERTPLDTRGWVLQERTLSPRIIHYGAQQLYWECLSSSHRQDGKYHDDAVNFQEEVGLVPLGNYKRTLGLYSPTDAEMLEEYRSALSRFMPDVKDVERCLHMDQWYYTVMDYTRWNLTFQSDKLAAIAGVAKTVQQQRGYTYLAGMWREDLVRGMMWWLCDIELSTASAIERSRIICDTLPSWTWARHSGEIDFIVSPEREAVSQVVSVSYEENGSFGQISSARLRLNGPVVMGHYNVSRSERGANLVGADGKAIGYARFDMPKATKLIGGDQLLCCILLRGYTGEALGLVLQQEGRQRNTYRRIGYIRDDDPKFQGCLLNPMPAYQETVIV
ncbi:het domain containing protein [Grosmannia clavigera kw1407]|uniref:Het domain containing protein n=1 Tax=Grosmannia clavigera (strain kw1407 / UAMH 11150) TaxID=655863 RepID=F0XKN2_GROCL|nr:het domain containing protein [Grosmannia clavigera kw1407]EFX01638.1 het domain containing protein [Grosmannia clavigera kw1407]